MPTGGVTAENGRLVHRGRGASPSASAAGWSATATPAGVTARARQVVDARSPSGAGRRDVTLMTADGRDPRRVPDLARRRRSPGPLAEAATFERHIAGAEANVAVGLARLGQSVAYIGRVGGDGFGVAIVRRLRGEGVDVGHLTVDTSATTGLMLRERRVLGAAQVVYARTGSAGSRLSRRRRRPGRGRRPVRRCAAGCTSPASPRPCRRTARDAVDPRGRAGHGGRA